MGLNAVWLTTIVRPHYEIQPSDENTSGPHEIANTEKPITEDVRLPNLLGRHLFNLGEVQANGTPSKDITVHKTYRK